MMFLSLLLFCVGVNGIIYPIEPGLDCPIMRQTNNYPVTQCTQDVVHCLYSDEAKRYVWQLEEDWCPAGTTVGGVEHDCIPADCESVAYSECTRHWSTIPLESDNPCSRFYYKCSWTYYGAPRVWHPTACKPGMVYDPTVEPTWKGSCKQDPSCL